MAERPTVVHSAEPLRAAGRLLAQALVAARGARGVVRLAIPGGSALSALAHARELAGAAWRRVRLTWVDERCVPFASAASNRGEAYRRRALDPNDRPAVELPLYLDGESGPRAVARVEAGLDRIFEGGLDVTLLGLGEEGHVASIFPGWGPPLVASAAFVTESPKPPAERITLTPRMLKSARSSVLLACGEAKRSALERLLRGDGSLPAHGLPGLVVVTDLDLDGPR